LQDFAWSPSVDFFPLPDDHAHVVEELRAQEAKLREEMQSGEQRASDLVRLAEVEKVKLRESESDLAVAEARAAEVCRVGVGCCWMLPKFFRCFSPGDQGSDAYQSSPGRVDAAAITARNRSSKSIIGAFRGKTSGDRTSNADRQPG
jgi:hypothetical protein